MSIELLKYPLLYDDASLQNYYRFEGNSNATKGSKNGTDTDITYGTSYGKFGQGALFNGSTSKITTDVLSTSTTNISFCAWVYPTSVNQLAAFFHNGTSGNGYGLFIGSGSGANPGDHLVMLLGAVAIIDLGVAFPDANKWYFVCLTRDTTTWKGYVNGVQTSLTSTTNPGTPTTLNQFGSLAGSLGEPLAGNMDDVSFFTKCLTPTEILNYYEAGVSSGFFLLL